MQRNLLPRVAVSALALAALLPLARADEKGDAILRKVELRAQSFKTYAATLVVDDPANHKIPMLVQVWVERKPSLRFRITSPDPDDHRWMLQNQTGLYVGTPANLEKQRTSMTALPPNLSFLTGDFATFVGGVRSTRWISEDVSGADRHGVDRVEVVGEKYSLNLTVTREGIVEKWEMALPGGKQMIVSVVKVEIDHSIPASVFSKPPLPFGIPAPKNRAE